MYCIILKSSATGRKLWALVLLLSHLVNPTRELVDESPKANLTVVFSDGSIYCELLSAALSLSNESSLEY